MAGVFAFDLLTPADWVAGGFYLIPLALIALTLRRRAIVVAGVIAVCLSSAVMVAQHVFASPLHLIYLYLLIVACGRPRRGLAPAGAARPGLEPGARPRAARPGRGRHRGALEPPRGAARAGRERRAAHRRPSSRPTWASPSWCATGSGAAKRRSARPADPQALCYPYDALVLLRHALEHERGALGPRRGRLVRPARPHAAGVPARLRARVRARGAAAGLRARRGGHGLQPAGGRRDVHAPSRSALPAAWAATSPSPSRTPG